MKIKNLKIFEYIFLFIILAMNFILYNYINLTSHNWPILASELEAYNVSKRIAQGKSIIENMSPLLSGEDNKLFTNSSVAVIKNKIVPRSAIGHFFIIAPGHLFGEEGVFYLSSCICLIGLIYFYFLIKGLFGIQTAFLGIILYTLSYNIIQWSNILNANIIGLTSFIIFLYYLLIFTKSKKTSLIYLLCVLFSLTVWMRYEYLIFSPNVIILLYKNTSKKNIIIFFSLLIILLIPILLMNRNLYGDFFSTGYTLPNASERQGYSYLISNTNQFFKDSKLLLTIKRFSGGIIHFDIERFKVNINRFISLTGIIIFLISTVGIITVFVDKSLHKIRKYFFILFMYTLFLIIFFGSAYYTDMYNSWLASVVSRYLLPLSVIIIIFSCGLFQKIINSSNKKITFFIITIIIYIVSLSQITESINNGHFGINDLRQRKLHAYNISKEIDKLPSNAVVISNTYAFRNVINRELINVDNIKKDSNLIDTINNYINILLLNNYSVYIIEDKKDAINYLNLPQKLPTNRYKINHSVDVDYDTIYKIDKI